jgi:SAM-dependent methyltransferase
MTLTKEREDSHERTRRLAVGEVMTLGQHEAQDKRGRLFMRRTVRVGDESDANPSLRQAYREMGAQGEMMLRANPAWESTKISDRKVMIDPQNSSAKWLYYEVKNGRQVPSQMVDWAKDFPGAIALEPLQRLGRGGRALPGGRLDERTETLFTYMTDAIGIRSRARIYADQLVKQAEVAGGHSLEIISVGSGAAIPNIDATVALEAQDTGVHWKLFDIDPTALEWAHDFIREEQFHYSTVDYGPLNEKQDKPGLFAGRSFTAAYKEPDESVDVVDALGLWEYLHPDTAAKFVQRLYPKLKSGGVMIVSNMLEDRPEREFNQRAVGWPDLYLRSETDLLDIIDQAGIDTRQVTMTHAQDGVYVVMEIRKP